MRNLWHLLSTDVGRDARVTVEMLGQGQAEDGGLWKGVYCRL